jgi:copper chaperone CopZ
MKSILILAALIIGMQANAQFTKVSLQASGLTCSMCSKAVKSALEEVAFVEKVQVDIKNQQYNLSFKQEAAIDFDALSKAVEDAGFSVANMKVTAQVNNITLEKDKHLQIGNHYFHFLNASGKQLNGTTTFNIVDKSFVSPNDFKKWSSKSSLACVQTGKASTCCTKENIAEASRVYHVII